MAYGKLRIDYTIKSDLLKHRIILWVKLLIILVLENVKAIFVQD